MNPDAAIGRPPRRDRHRSRILHGRGGAADRTRRCRRQAREADRLGAPARRSATAARRRLTDADPEPARVWLVGGACGAAGRLRGRGGRGGDRADRSGVGAAGHPRLGTARQAHDGADADAQSRRTTAFRRGPRRAAALAGRRFSLGGRGSGRTRTPAAPVVRRGGHAARRERCRLGRGSQRPHHARPRTGVAAPSCRHPGCCPPGCSPRCGSSPRGARRRPRWSRSSSGPTNWCAWHNNAHSWPRPGC